jgi:phenylpropionate dioxygenase-like ring-hydroxylating dioxygenase large terminal subunit
MNTLICLNNKPVIEEMGIIFVWPGKAELAHESLVPRFMFREKEWEGWDFYEDHLDLDFPHELMVDNLMDSAHIDFTHE